MNEWGDGTGFEQNDNPQASGSLRGGPLHVGMSICSLIAVSAVSFLLAWLMSDHVRSFWEMGLVFAAPFAALMGSTILVDKATRKMTPNTSRKSQAVFAAVTIVAAFVIGCLAEVLHQPVIVEHVEPAYDYLIIMDKSGSMVFWDLEKPCQQALNQLIDTMEDENRVGIIAFDDKIQGRVSMAALDDTQRGKIHGVINTKIYTYEETDPVTGETYSVGGGTFFSDAMDEAMRMLGSDTPRERTVRIIMVTDGDDQSVGNFNAFTSWAKKQNSAVPEGKQIEFCAVQIGEAPMLDMVKKAVEATGGTIYDGTRINDLAAKLQSLKKTTIVPEKIDTLKATYAGQTADGKPNTPYMIISAAMLLILGLLTGFSLMMMFSVRNQFRFQIILSPLMGICAFLLLNFGQKLGISPAWVCEGLAFSLFGIVLMRENNIAGKELHFPEEDLIQTDNRNQTVPAADPGFDDF